MKTKTTKKIKKIKITVKEKPNKDVFKFYKIETLNCNIIFFYSDEASKLSIHLNDKKNKDISKWLFKHIESLPISNNLEMGYLSYNQESKRPLVLFIKRRKKIDWDLYETMIHEITHLVQHIEIYFNIEEEQEFRAYLTESIFRDLRKLI